MTLSQPFRRLAAAQANGGHPRMALAAWPNPRRNGRLAMMWMLVSGGGSVDSIGRGGCFVSAP